MMLKYYIRLAPLVLSVGLVLLAGCASPNAQQTRFYRLSPQPEPAVAAGQVGEKDGLQPKLGVGQVTLASYLDRPQLVNRVGPYRLLLNDFEHWAGTLQENISSGLVSALQARLGTDAVIAYPWHSAVRPRYELVLDFSRFDAEAEQVVIQARWTLLAERGDKLLGVRQLTILEPIRGSGPEALVAAASSALDRLAENLSAVLSRYP